MQTKFLVENIWLEKIVIPCTRSTYSLNESYTIAYSWFFKNQNKWRRAMFLFFQIVIYHIFQDSIVYSFFSEVKTKNPSLPFTVQCYQLYLWLFFHKKKSIWYLVCVFWISYWNYDILSCKRQPVISLLFLVLTLACLIASAANSNSYDNTYA